MTAQHDQECLRRVQAGDPQALAQLYDRFTPLLFAVALRILGGMAEAEEAIEETWHHVWRRAAAYDARRSTVAAWLAMIVRGKALDRRRTAGYRAPGAAAAAAATSSGAGEAVMRLGAHERDVLELAYFEGLTESEIAQRSGTDAETVRAWTVAGVTQLRDLMPPGEWL